MKRRVYDIAPKPTNYKGILFRSSLEVYWAAFFDALGWQWLYEPTKFKLPCGVYIPDFYFPDINCYGEVKPGELNELERLKCVELSLALPDVPILPLIKTPSGISIKTITNGGDFLDVVLVPYWDKFYPFFYTDTFDEKYFYTTSAALNTAARIHFSNKFKQCQDI